MTGADVGLPRKHVLVLSHDETGPSVFGVVAAAREVFAAIDSRYTHVVMPGLHVLASGLDPSDLLDREAGTLMLLLSRDPRTIAGTLLQPEDLLARMYGAHYELADVAPPFAAIGRQVGAVDVRAVTDAIGLRHLHHRTGAGWAAVSTTGSLLARLAPDTLDASALGFFSLAGCHIGQATPWSSVRKLPPASIWSASSGRSRLTSYAEQSAAWPTRLSFADAVEAGRSVVRDAVNDALADYETVTLELSGGLDSRLLLAAVPARSRHRLRAVTLGRATDPDVVLAGAIAERCGLDHHVVGAGVEGLDATRVVELADVAAARGDYSANPLATAVLLSAERSLGQGPRLNGQNGEFARGFYYGGQPPARSSSHALSHALARWRVFANDRVDEAILRPELRARVRRSATRAVVDLLDTFVTDWLSATDELYLHLRMQHWVGTEFSASAMDRPVLSPFFDPRFVRWARRCRPQDKRGSRVLSAVLTSLDGHLGEMPLASGTSPCDLASSRPAQRARRARTSTVKTARKALQRLHASDRPPAGAALVGDTVQSAWVSGLADVTSLRTCELLDQSTLGDVLAGRRRLSPSTIGFLMDLHGAAAALEDHGAGGPGGL